MLLVTVKIVFWISIFALIHPYSTYFLYLYLKTKNKKNNFNSFTRDDNLPFVSIVMAVHNEEQILEKKIRSIFTSNYPRNLYEIIVGSDASIDKTNKILEKFYSQEANFYFKNFIHRTGKVNIVNNLIHKAKGEILLLSDADIIFTKNTIFELVKYFKEEKIGLVDSNLQKRNSKPSGVSIQEKFYFGFEMMIKNKEGILAGVMMGPFGGAYALRRKLFSEVPENYLVDDFYINMKVIEKKMWSVNNLKAIVYDSSSDNINDEFKRKVRISTGNFQNLKEFAYSLISKPFVLAFGFFSHKVLRWLGPVFILLIIISSILLFNSGMFYQIFATLLFFSLIIPIIDYFLRKCGIHIILLRFVSHYYYMNLGLLVGLFKYIKGVKTNVWEPTKRESKF